ncbi:MAG: nucleotidyltransferase domain-containing protein [Anaerolineae bacterium]
MSKLRLRHLERFEAGYQDDIRAYCGRIAERYGDRLRGVLLFGSLARGEARPYDSLESDIDLIVVIEGLSPLSPRVLEKIEVERGVHTLVCAVWMTPAELAAHIQATDHHPRDSGRGGYGDHRPRPHPRHPRRRKAGGLHVRRTIVCTGGLSGRGVRPGLHFTAERSPSRSLTRRGLLMNILCLPCKSGPATGGLGLL